MDRKFGFKDFALFTLLTTLIVVVLLAIKQYDRQWRRLDEVKQALQTQNEKIDDLADRLAGGVRIDNGTGNGPSTGDPNAPVPTPGIAASRKMEGFAEGDWYVWPIAANIKSLTPYVAGDIYQQYVEDIVMQSLAEFDTVKMQWQPVIAKSWSSTPDGLTHTFKLRDDVKFSDGSPLTAEDVVFTWSWIMNPKVNAPRTRAYFEKFEDVSAPDAYTVVFKLKDPYFMGFVNMAGMAILSKKYYGQFSEEEFNELPGLLFGSGPYKLNFDPVEWRPGSSQIALVRNDHYWGPKPGLDRIVFREIKDELVRVTAFRNGEIDVLPATPQQYLDLRTDPEVRKKADIHIYSAINGGYIYVGWNQRREGEPTLFADKRVRQAMAYLVDRKTICDRILEGLATPTSGPFHPLGEQDDPTLKPRAYNLEKGVALLKEAGFEDRNGDGVIESPDGKPFKFKLIISASSETTKEIAFFMRDTLKNAGIELELDPLDWTIMQQKLDDRSFDAIMLGWGAGWIETDPNQMFHSDQTEDGGDNYVFYKSEKLDGLIDSARVEVDDAKRTEMWREVHRTLYEDQPYLFMYNRKSVIFLDKRYKNVKITPTGMIDTLLEWYVPRDLQKRGK